MKYHKSKKADLSLSTNAIVILILAITILGLGLTFVRGLFKQAESKVSETFSATELANPPTRDNPTTIAPGILNLRQKESGKAVVAYYNTYNGQIYCKLEKGTAQGVAAVIAAVSIEISSSEALIQEDGINSWVISVGASDTASGTLLQPIKIRCGATKAASATTFPTGAGASTITKDLVVTVTT